MVKQLFKVVLTNTLRVVADVSNTANSKIPARFDFNTKKTVVPVNV